MSLTMEPLDQRRGEFFLAGAGSADVNGSYVQTNSEVDVIFYEKRPSDSWFLHGEISKSSGVVFIITLDSLPAMGEDFELAWVLKSHDAVIFYAAPFEEDEEMPPLKGWVAIEGLDPPPCHVIQRPFQPPHERTSKLQIIVEDEERDFSLPDWEPDELEIPGSVVETDTFDPFYGWDNNFGDDDSGEYSSEQDDSDEIDLPVDLMDNFKDGMFGHRPKDNSVERRPYDQAENKEEGGDNIFLESDSSEFDECIVRHDTEEYDGERLGRISSISSQGEADLNDELLIESQGSQGVLDESDMTSSSQLLGDQANNNQESKESKENILSLDMKSRKSEKFSEKPCSPGKGERSPRSPGKSPRSPGRSPHSPGQREGSRVGCSVLRRRSSGENHKALVIALPEDPFSTPSHSRYRRSRDYIDIDLVTAPPELLSALSPRRKSARRLSGRNSFEMDTAFQMPRRRSSERRRSGASDTAMDSKKEPVERKKSLEAGMSLDEQKKDEEKSPMRAEEAIRLKQQRKEMQKLQKEAHQLKTKMRKCDRISKVRKRGTTLSKVQQDLLVNKSKYQHRYEEIKKLLGSDNIKS